MVRTDAWLGQCRFRFTHLDSLIQSRLLRWQEKSDERLTVLERLIRGYQPEAVLKRGYAIVRNAAGNVQSSVVGVKMGDALSIQVKDGMVVSVVSPN
jgi:exodeoxyribonuclease VII large subunit